MTIWHDSDQIKTQMMHLSEENNLPVVLNKFRTPVNCSHGTPTGGATYALLYFTHEWVTIGFAESERDLAVEEFRLITQTSTRKLKKSLHEARLEIKRLEEQKAEILQSAADIGGQIREEGKKPWATPSLAHTVRLEKISDLSEALGNLGGY